MVAITTLPLDPRLSAHFFDCEHHARPLEEVDAWWDRPFAIRMEEGLAVFCLDGQRPTSPTLYGIVADENEAMELASNRLSTWLEQRRRPFIKKFEDDGLYGVLRRAQRPWDDVELFQEFETEEEAIRFLEALRQSARWAQTSVQVDRGYR